MNKKLLISALAAGSIVLSSGAAQAGAVATAYLKITDALFTKDTTGNGIGDTKLIVGTDITLPGNATNNGDTSAGIGGGAPDTHTGDALASAAGLNIINSFDGTYTTPINPPGSSTVAGTYTDNDFTYIKQFADATTDYAVGDALLSGAIFDFPPVPPGTPNAEAETLAEVSISSLNNVGTAAGNNVGVQTTITFIATATTTYYFDLKAEGYARALLTADLDGVSADASYNWSVSLLDSVTNIDQTYAPGDLNKSRSATTPGQDFEFDLALSNFGTSFTVIAGRQYQLTIDHVSDANAHTAKVPEPLPLALISFGLLSLGLRKRHQS